VTRGKSKELETPAVNIAFEISYVKVSLHPQTRKTKPTEHEEEGSAAGGAGGGALQEEPIGSAEDAATNDWSVREWEWHRKV